jgi:acetoin utilization deacetylase AcuC-like enzyme
MANIPLIWSPEYEVDIGPHVFPTAKYRLVRKALLDGDVAVREDFQLPAPASWEEVGAVHTQEWVEKVREGSLSIMDQMTLELPFSPPLREASLLCCGGTTMTCRRALDEGIAAHLGGGFHHAFAGHGEGFCLLNDIAVALVGLLDAGEVERCAVVDLDLHHGNGTAAIFRDDSRVFTMSMHQEHNYPHPKPPSDLDIGLRDGIRDEAYLSALEDALEAVLSRQRPELVLYLAGADPFVEDQLGGLALTKAGLEERDRMVMEGCTASGAAVAVVLAGGYARREEDTVAIHRKTVEVAREVWLAQK